MSAARRLVRLGTSSGSDVERYSAEIGYWLGETYWGRGIATEALVLVTAHVFDSLNMLRLFALPFADNAGSIRVLEKAGYRTRSGASIEQREVRSAARPAALRPRQYRVARRDGLNYAVPRRTTYSNRSVEYLLKQYGLQQGALEIQYIEEFFLDFPRKKTANEVIQRLSDRDHQILMAEAALPDDPGMVVPVSFKVSHELRAAERDPKLADLVASLEDVVEFDDRRILYQWIGGTRKDWRGQGHFRALTEEQEVWALANGFDEIIVKTKNKFYEMRSTLAQLHFNVIRFVQHPFDPGESKVFLSKRLGQHVIDRHRSRRSVVRTD